MKIHDKHIERFRDPTFETIKNMPREWLAAKLALIYTKLKVEPYSAKARSESVEYIENALEYAEDRDDETADLFNQKQSD